MPLSLGTAPTLGPLIAREGPVVLLIPEPEILLKRQAW